MMNPTDIGMIRRALALLVEPGQLVELRALKVRTQPADPYPRTVSGYFTDHEQLAVTAARIHGAEGVYVTMNPVDPALQARAANRARPCGKGDATTSDSDIVCRRFLFLDFDAVRPSGISATEAEKSAVAERAERVRHDLVARGWPEPLVADSGNGVHLLFRVALSTDDGGLLERVVQAISARYSDAAVSIDTSTANPAHLIPLYGTLKAKGDSTDDRPHRQCKILKVPAELNVVPAGVLESMARLAPSADRLALPHMRGRSMEIGEWLKRHGLEVRKGPLPWQGGQRWELRSCPWNEEHNRGEAFVVQLPSGAVAAGCHHASCTWGWPDLRERFEAPRAQPATDKTDKSPSGSLVSPPLPRSQDSAAASRPEEGWPDPAPLPEELLPVPPFDMNLLPTKLRPWVEDITERMQCPPDFPAVGAMISLAGVIGRKIAIRPKREDDWAVVPNLWGGAIGRPGVLKTPAIQEVTRPLRSLENEAKDRFKEEERRGARRRLIRKERERIAQEAARKALAEGRDPDEAVRAVLDDEDDDPVRRRYLTNDCTVEKLGELLRENPNGLTVLRDELTGFLRSLDQEGREGSRAFFLEAWNGNGSFTFDRIGRGTIEIEAAIVSILGGIQPGPLRAYLRSSTQYQGDDGLIQRFQLLVWPDVSTEWTNVDQAPDSAARHTAETAFQRLSNLDPEHLGAKPDPGDPTSRPFLRFSPDAQERFDWWRERLERLLHSGDLHPTIESHLAKYRSLIPSLALLIHLAGEGPDPWRWSPSTRRSGGVSTSWHMPAASTPVSNLRTWSRRGPCPRRSWQGMSAP